MKRTLTLFGIVLLTLACHAQSLKWELPLPIPATWGGFYPGDGGFPDGGGGGVILIKAQPPGITRIVWFDSAGRITLTNDFVRVASQTHPESSVNVLRVTPKVLDLHGLIYYPDENSSQGYTFIRRFRKGQKESTDTVLNQGVAREEALVSVVVPVADKKGFFTFQPSGTNWTVRRYAF